MPRKRGPGHPVTTGSKSTPPVSYRVSADQHAELTREGCRTKRTANQVAKDRAFPLPDIAARKRARGKG